MSQSDQASWSQRLWESIEPIYRSIVTHPFVGGLTDGSLDETVFAHYVVQDALYLRDYARALAIVGAKAPTMADTAMFAKHATEASAVELLLHDSLMREMGLDADVLASAAATPTTRAYTSYLLATAYGGSFAEGLAAVLPCYWIYAKVGTALAERGSPDGRYQLWIDNYGGDEFAATVDEVLALTDHTGLSLGAADESAARAHFVTTSRYEWMFFDAAYRRETWPV